MISLPWWERYPERLTHELDALRLAGIAQKRDEDAFARGILRLHLEVPHAGERLPLVVTFPDLYPYFRFQVDAPTLALSHHQNPFGKNLCLIGRGTHEWRTTDTVAGLLRQQLPVVLESGASADRAAVAGKEQQQAEPFSDYYVYPESMVIVPGGWTVPPESKEGTFTVAIAVPQGPPPDRFVRGMMSSLRSKSGRTLLQANTEVCTAFPGETLEGRWLRVSEPIRHIEQQPFLEDVLSRSQFAGTAPANRVDGGWLQLWGILFPEEVAWRTDGEGWVFICLFDEKRARIVRRDPPTKRLKGPKRNKQKKRRKNRSRKR